MLRIVIVASDKKYLNVNKFLSEYTNHIVKIIPQADLDVISNTITDIQPDIAICANEDKDMALKVIKTIKTVCLKTAVIMLDESDDHNLFFKALESDIDSYFQPINMYQLPFILEAICLNDIMVIPKTFKKMITRKDHVDFNGDIPGNVDLTIRERDVYSLLTHRYTNKEIAAALFISETTVKTHVSSIFKKLGVKTRNMFFSRIKNQ
jgi:DNA-binding NarL/FixJ family response regulator